MSSAPSPRFRFPTVSDDGSSPSARPDEVTRSEHDAELQAAVKRSGHGSTQLGAATHQIGSSCFSCAMDHSGVGPSRQPLAPGISVHPNSESGSESTCSPGSSCFQFQPKDVKTAADAGRRLTLHGDVNLDTSQLGLENLQIPLSQDFASDSGYSNGHENLGRRISDVGCRISSLENQILAQNDEVRALRGEIEGLKETVSWQSMDMKDAVKEAVREVLLSQQTTPVKVQQPFESTHVAQGDQSQGGNTIASLTAQVEALRLELDQQREFQSSQLSSFTPASAASLTKGPGVSISDSANSLALWIHDSRISRSETALRYSPSPMSPPSPTRLPPDYPSEIGLPAHQMEPFRGTRESIEVFGNEKEELELQTSESDDSNDGAESGTASRARDPSFRVGLGHHPSCSSFVPSHG